ncbi:MAG: (Fe-S)-binding protein [Ferrimicrobium sp.]
MFDNDDACIKCSLCVSACPVYAVDANFPGPKVLGPDWLRRFQSGDLSSEPYVQDCIFCQLCEAACPVNVPIAHLIAEHKTLERLEWRERLRDIVLTHPQWLARIPQLTLVPKTMARVGRISTTTAWPRPTKLRVWPTSSKRASGARRVGLYIDCFSRGFDADTITAAHELLTLWGYEVTVVPQASSCCGAAAHASGHTHDAEATARRTWSNLSKSVQGLEALVTVNATCDSTLREEWPKYWAISLPVPVISFVEFAIAHAPTRFWEELADNADESTSITKTWIHATCRSTASRGGAPMMHLAQLGSLPQPTSLELTCCGAGGSYAFKQEHEETAHAMGAKALAKNPLPGEIIMVDSGPCALHLTQITGLVARHPAFLLNAQYQYRRTNDLAEGN